MSSIPITRDSPFIDEAERRRHAETLCTLVYDELRRLAYYYMKRERSNHTLQPTALVHEAYLRLANQREIANYSRTQFIALAAEMMRRILVNHAVSRNRQKREGQNVRITLDRAVEIFEEREMDLLVLDEALGDLARLDPRQEKIFELRFFGGLTVEETADVLDVSPATVKREWATAKLWLQRRLRQI